MQELNKKIHGSFTFKDGSKASFSFYHLENVFQAIREQKPETVFFNIEEE